MEILLRHILSPNKTPFDITSPISVPSFKSIVHRAKNPTKVVKEEPITDCMVSIMAFSIALNLSFSFFRIYIFMI